ncbi:MAG: hypothetical protein COB30_007645 [Ectothiorhodospiraceae bacterium]|nr:hypothetical protein [Ectothiorhodospiraceae bacterium]
MAKHRLPAHCHDKLRTVLAALTQNKIVIPRQREARYQMVKGGRVNIGNGIGGPGRRGQKDPNKK